jgi:peptidoglycan hydrolase-like protein with peptidoglycan-binding domain
MTTFYKYGCKHPNVIQIKKSLLRNDYRPGEINDIFDQQTKTAVRDFQRDKNLKIDGQVGPITCEVDPIIATTISGS